MRHFWLYCAQSESEAQIPRGETLTVFAGRTSYLYLKSLSLPRVSLSFMKHLSQRGLYRAGNNKGEISQLSLKYGEIALPVGVSWISV